MSPAVLRRVLMPLSTLMLLAALAWPASPAAASRAGAATHHGALAPSARHSRHIRVYGYLMDSQPWHDQWLKVYSKTHATTYYVEMTASTVVKIRTRMPSNTSQG